MSDGAVTSLDFNGEGDTLVAGYTSGRVSLFNVVTGKLIKVGNAAPGADCCYH